MNNVIILGAGRIGRGFLARLLHEDGREPVFFAATDATVQRLHGKTYEIHVLGAEEKNVLETEVQAFSVKDTEALASQWARTELIFTACGGKNLEALGGELAKAFQLLRSMGKAHVSNIVTCENWKAPEKVLKEAICGHLTQEERADFERLTGVTESAVMCSGTGASEPSALHYPMDTWVEDVLYLPVNAKGMKGELPQLSCIEFLPDFGSLLRQKLYTRNTSIATIGYLGRLKGLTYVAEAAADPEIAPILDELYREVSEILVQSLGIDREKQRVFAKRADAKNRNPLIIDPLTRIGRDPIRKLSPEDRLIGPLREGAALGLSTDAIALGCAAALYYEDPEDEAACRLAELRREKGTDYILKEICGLDPEGEEAKRIRRAQERLKEKGWIQKL